MKLINLVSYAVTSAVYHSERVVGSHENYHVEVEVTVNGRFRLVVYRDRHPVISLPSVPPGTELHKRVCDMYDVAMGKLEVDTHQPNINS